MSGPDVVDTETPSPPWRPRDDRRRHFFQRLSDRTPLRTKLIAALLALVVIALAAIGVASTYIARESLLRQHDADLASVLQHPNQVSFLVNNSGGLTLRTATTTKSHIVVG